MSLINDLFSRVESSLLDSRHIPEGQNIKTPGALVQPGDVEVVDIVLLSEDLSRGYSMMAQCTSIDLYESIMSPVIFCELVVADSIGLLQSFPIIGEEYVKIIYKTPKNAGKPAEYLFRINKVDDKRVNESNKRLTYKLQLVSSELFRNARKLVTKRANDNIHNIVRQIMDEELLTSKPIFVEDTKGIEQILITSMEPFQAIDFLRHRAVSPRYISSSFCFYENKDGFFFTTVERLMEEGARELDSGNSDKIFFFDTLRRDSIENVTFRNIIAYNHVSFGDAISQIAGGGIQNQIHEFDLITGNVRLLTYTDNLGGDEFVSTSGASTNHNTSGFIRNHGGETRNTKIVATRSDKPQTQIPEKMTMLQAYTQKLINNIVHIHVYGDSDITIGNMIQVQLPSGVDAQDQAGVSRLDSGNYLVCKARHMILLGDRPQYTMSLELIKHDLQETM